MKGIILLNFGGPRSQRDIYHFLRDLFSDVLPSPLKPFAPLIALIRAPASKKLYKKIGGSSPVIPLTEKMASALQKKLGDQYKVYSAHLYGGPYLKDVVLQAAKDGADTTVTIPLFPYGLGKYWDEPSWHDNPYYTKAIQRTIREQLQDPSLDIVLFSPHAVPLATIKKGSNYVDNIQASVSRIMKDFPNVRHVLSYQSAAGPIKWTGPSTKDTIDRIKEGSRIIIVPLGFVCDNLETLYEIDQLYIPQARGRGLKAVRARCLNDDDLLIEILANLALKS